MIRPAIGALVIGQAPRPDLTDPIRSMLPDHELIVKGALDDLTQTELPPVTGKYPLVTHMRNGSVVQVEESFLGPQLQLKVAELEAQNVQAIILLCAGTFEAVTSSLPLIKPFDVGKTMLINREHQTIGFIAPIVEQEPAIAARWAAAGFRPKTWTAPLTADPTPHLTNLDCIVLDYVGHPTNQVAELQARCSIPVLDLGQLAFRELKKIVGEQSIANN